MINMNNIYIGLIKASPAYFKNPHRFRTFLGMNYDPFMNMDEETAIKVGTPTIVLLENGEYHDILWGRYKNDIIYHLQNYNSLGICLSYIDSFLKYYPFIYPIPYVEEQGINHFQEYQDLSYFFIQNEVEDGIAIVLNKLYGLDSFLLHYDFHTFGKSFDLKQYFLGIVKMDPTYYDNPFVLQRQNLYYPCPFANVSPHKAIKKGIPTVLMKEENNFYDILYGQYKGDLIYKLHQTNEMGISLIHTAPFLQYYNDWTMYPMVYTVPTTVKQAIIQNQLPYTIFKTEEKEGITMHLNDQVALVTFYQDYYEKEKIKKKV